MKDSDSLYAEQVKRSHPKEKRRKLLPNLKIGWEL
jgi:hypothetical protein